MRPIPDLSSADRAFPAMALDWMPKPEELPPDIRQTHSSWYGLFRDLFYGVGDKSLSLYLVPRLGVDGQKAFDVVKATMGSFAPKHEHKEDAVAFMLGDWFAGFVWLKPFNVAGVTMGSNHTYFVNVAPGMTPEERVEELREFATNQQGRLRPESRKEEMVT